MKNSKKIIAVLLCLVFVFALCSCAKKTPEPEGPIPYSGEDEDSLYREYAVTKYELEDGAFEVSGDLNLYKYEDLSDAENVIDVINGEFNSELVVDETLDRSDGYGNWSWDNGNESDRVNLAVSLSSKTGKFSLYYKPSNEIVYLAAKGGLVGDGAFDDQVTEFVEKFEFVTGKLTLEQTLPVTDMYYPYISGSGEDSQDLLVMGRRYFFVSENYSKQRVDAQEGLNCYVECANSDIENREVQYFVVTIISDGTIVSVDNNITKAPIVPDGTKAMLDESEMDQLLEYFRSTAEDDTLVIKRIYLDSYTNYFGRPDIIPVFKVEYYYKSSPDDVQTTEFSLEGFNT